MLLWPLGCRPFCAQVSWLPLLTIVGSTDLRANQTTRYCLGQQPTGPGLFLR
jgi:hypothetical protein